MLTRMLVAGALILSTSMALAQEPELGRGEMLLNADANKDGMVSRDEFLAARAEQAGKTFDRVDTNHDGVLSAQEIEAVKAAAKGRLGRRRDRSAQ
jgi:hypothetical protein